jgi:PDZ domain-containing protein
LVRSASSRSVIRTLILIVLTFIVAFIGWYKIPFFIYGPGAAVNLNDAIVVPTKTPPPGALFLTDIRLLPGRPIFYAIARIMPGYEIVPRGDLVPASVTDKQLDVQLVDAMTESQLNAQVVAERAAGLTVNASIAYYVNATLPKSPGAHCFARGDAIVALDGKSFGTNDDLMRMTARHPVGTSFALTVERGKKQIKVACRTFLYKHYPRFGIQILAQTRAYHLPVAVTYRLPDINGSSAGLMFALQIYRTLTGADITGGRNIAGTGVLAADGSVSPIAGTREKVQAAIRAHAVVFLVPADNYKEIEGTPGIQIIPVRSFSEALHALALSRVPKSKTG